VVSLTYPRAAAIFNYIVAIVYRGIGPRITPCVSNSTDLKVCHNLFRVNLNVLWDMYILG
jgi:hypothetical protein